MLSSYSSKIFLRGLRGTRKGVSGSIKFEDVQKTVTLLSEEDFNALEKNQISHEDASLDCPLLEVTNSLQPQSDIIPPFLQKNKKYYIRNLQELAIKYPLKEPLTIENQFKKLSEVLTPLHEQNFSYMKQLKIKQRHVETELAALRFKLKRAEAFLTYSPPSRPQQVNLPCPLEDIVPSLEAVGYRNIDDLSIHIGVDEDPKTVGCLVGFSKDPFKRCVPPTHAVSMKDSHKLIAQRFQEFIRQSEHPTCLKAGDQQGVWRRIVVRSNRRGEEHMVAVTVNSLPFSPESKEELKEDLAQYYFNGPGAECGITSLLLQACPWRSCTRMKAPYELIRGQPYLEEECLGLKLRLYPDSVFEVSTQAAEALCCNILKLLKGHNSATLLDICCGSGALSLLLAPHFRRVIAIDAYPSAIDDARMNANLNDIHNIDFFQGKIETLIPHTFERMEGTSEVVAVIYPSRKPLDSSVFQDIRNCKEIKKLIYIAEATDEKVKHNLTLLGATLKESYWGSRSEKRQMFISPSDQLTDPFVLKYVIPMDLYPQTLHVHFIMMYERSHLWIGDSLSHRFS